MEAVEDETTEGDLDSFTDDKDALEFPLTFLSAETREDMEEDTEEVCWAEKGWEEVQEEEDVWWGEAVLSAGCFWSFPFEEVWDGEQEEGTGGDTCAAGDALGSAAGEDGGDIWDKSFFSEECEDRDSWLPMGVVPGLLLNVSPEGTETNHITERLNGKSSSKFSAYRLRFLDF